MDKDEIRKIGSKISYYRKLKGLSQRVLGELVGVSRSKISDIELGKDNLDIELFVKIAACLDVDYSEIIKGQADIFKIEWEFLETKKI